MALINCPECNHVISDKSKKCINCGCWIKKKKNKPNKRIVILFCSSLISSLIVLFTITIIISQVSISQYFNLISEKNFSCILGKHSWKLATCEKAKYCSICNSEKGEPIEHQWKEADCINSKVCLYCKKTDGSPLGHTVNIGYCSRCNKYINNYEIEFTVLKESLSCIEKSFNKIADYFNKTSASASIELYYCTLAKDEAIDIKKAACIARDMCGDISEFAELKKCFSNIDGALSGQIDTELTIDNYISYANSLSPKVANGAVAYNETVAEMNRLIKG